MSNNHQSHDGATTSAAYKQRSALDDFVAHNFDSHWRSVSQDSSLNFSDHADEDTIDINTPSRQRVAAVERTHSEAAAAAALFEPSEMTGRSTECSVRTTIDGRMARPSNNLMPGYASSMRMSLPVDCADGDHSMLLSTEEILSQSMAEEVRQMAVGLSQMKVRQSYGVGSARQSNVSYAPSLANTADMSFDSKSSFKDDDEKSQNGHIDMGSKCDDVWTPLSRPPSTAFLGMQNKLEEADASFRSSNLTDFLDNEQREWVDEFGDLPRQTSIASGTTSTSERRERQFMDETDFSSSRMVHTNLSMGNFFSARSENLRAIIPKSESPKKLPRPGALISPDRSHVAVDKSVLSVSRIAQLTEGDSHSPRSFVERILQLHPQSPSGSDVSAQQLPCSADTRPTYADDSLGQVLYVTEPMKTIPAPINPSQNVKILQVEQVYGTPERILRTLQSNNLCNSTKAPNTVLTPNRQHIVSNIFAKNDVVLQANKENTMAGTMDRFLSDTVSCTESMLDYVHSDLSDGARNTLDSAGASSPDTYVIANGSRKRSRTADDLRSSLGSASADNSLPQATFSTPPQDPGRSMPQVENAHVLQARSRLGLTLQLNCSATSAAGTVDNLDTQSVCRTPSPNRRNDDRTLTGDISAASTSSAATAIGNVDNSAKSSPASSTFSSPRFCSSKSEGMFFGGGGGGGVINNAQSHYGSTDLLQTTGNELSALKTSALELCWGSIKLRKSTTKRFTLKNMSSRKLSLKMEIVGPGFQIAGTQSTCTQLALQSQECRTISVTFCPTMIGPAIGRVTFYNADETPAASSVSLFGYGGNTVMQVLGVTRGPIGLPFITLGEHRDVASATATRQTFSIHNRGPLSGMVVVRVKPPSAAKDIRVTPAKCVLGAESQQQIEVLFTPRKAEMRKLFRKPGVPVLTVATLELIYGDDANRLRIARLLPQLHAGAGGEAYASLNFLASGFAGEQPLGVEHFDESAENVNELFSNFKSEEVALTVERVMLNETTDTEPDLQSSLEETMMFRTLKPVVVESSSSLQRMGSTLAISTLHLLDNAGGSGGRGDRNQRSASSSTAISGRLWSVHPQRLLLSAHGDCVRNIIIASYFDTEQTFELVSNCPRVLEVRPCTGVVHPGEQLQVCVRLLNVPMPDEDIVLGVYMENDKLDVQIHVQGKSRMG